MKKTMNPPIRILHVIGKMDRAGAETMLMNLYRSIDRSIIQFDFMVFTEEEGNYDSEIRSLGGKIYNLPPFTGINLFSYYKKWEKFLKQHPEHQIVHGHISSTAAIYLQIAKKLGRYTIAHSHSTSRPQAILNLPVRLVTSYYFAASREAGERRYGKKIANSSHFSVLKNAIHSQDYVFSEEKRKNMRQALGIEGKFVVGHVGRLTEAKNHQFIIQTFKELTLKKKDACLLLIGKGELEEEIKQGVRDLDVEDQVYFLGVRSDIPDLLQAMDVFFFPSLWEGLGVALIEAQASGLHSVVSTGIPREADIQADLVDFISLDENKDIWISALLQTKGIQRTSEITKVIESGYDIAHTSKMLQEFYLNRVDSKFNTKKGV